MTEGQEITPFWIAEQVKQQAADEWLLAELIKDVIVTLRSRGISRPQAVIEGYRTASDIVRRCSFYDEQSPLAHASIALRVFCMALPPEAGASSSKTSPSQENSTFSSTSPLAPPIIQEAEHRSKYRGRRREESRKQANHLPGPPKFPQEGREVTAETSE